jgi:hypothetical protein
MLTPGKRLILCLDGTWVNSDQGYNRPTVGQKNATLQIPTNVTRLHRALRKRDAAGWTQIMYYHSGVGTSGGLADSVAGGVFGVGVSEVSDDGNSVDQCLMTHRRISGKRTLSSQQTMNLAMRLFWLDSLVAHSLPVVLQ